MNNPTDWMVYAITHIDTRNIVFMCVKGEIVISSYKSALASALVRAKDGQREFYWEQAGPFSTQREAREVANLMAQEWAKAPDRIPEQIPWTAAEMREHLGRPRETVPVPLETREAFMRAARDRVATNKKAKDEYLSGYAAPSPDPAKARKTNAEKALTLLKQRQRRHQGKLLVRAGKLRATFE